ncbi:MaoC family dehydratase [Nocardioides eburneiflavus]|uniref:MaoC family dehydratase n=1 Tax=Nocardioides eburneiflavus TaxID=2518372 RepID=A0A4Z1CI75_9ACTN|nr:MaoC family dehydratase [Nocardioides eburneiflavus]TGN66078.1 MaoC family dehydratase [Nocardioides eburneiflavus]
MATSFGTLDEFRAASGTHLGAGPWMAVDQERIQSFADVTEDWQWIHVDVDRAARSDMGSTIAHGYLTLSLLPRLSSGIFEFTGAGKVLNYGLDRVRFLNPVRAGDRIRAHAELVEVTDSGDGALGRVRYTLEIDGRVRPACVVEALMLALPA